MEKKSHFKVKSLFKLNTFGLSLVVVSFVVDAVFLVVPNVAVVALFVFTDPMIYNCGQLMFILGS